MIFQARAVLINAGQANAATVSAYVLHKESIFFFKNRYLAKRLHCPLQGDDGYQDTVECANAVAEVFTF